MVVGIDISGVLDSTSFKYDFNVKESLTLLFRLFHEQVYNEETLN